MIKVGNEYIDFINKLFTNNPPDYSTNNEYDVKVFDDCHKMVEAIKKKDKGFNRLRRVISGYSFYWRVKARDKTDTRYNQDYDFEIDRYKFSWNENFNACDFISNLKNIEKIGCIYTVQEHNLNYADVIFVEDISYNQETKQIEYHPDKLIDTYSKSTDISKIIQNISNTYKFLLIRGVYGIYIYAVDKNLRKFISSLVNED